MFWTKGRFLVEFDEFSGYEERKNLFKETLCALEVKSKKISRAIKNGMFL